MASTYSTNLKIELIGTGEQSGVWGQTTNNNLGTAVEEAIVGQATVNFTTDADLTITLANSNAAQAARAFVLNVTSGVSLTTTRNLVVPTINKTYVVQNNTTGGQSIVVKTASGTGVTVPNSGKAYLYVDGTNVISAIDTISANTATPALTIRQSGAGSGLVVFGDVGIGIQPFVNSTTLAPSRSPVIASPDGYYSAGARFESPSWKNTHGFQGGWALYNADGVLSIRTGPSPGAAGSTFTTFAEALRVNNDGQVRISSDNTTSGLTITQTGTGNALVVEDDTSPDSTPFVVDGTGRVVIGGSADSGSSLTVVRPITGAATTAGVRSTGQVQSDVTTHRPFISITGTAAESFTLSNLSHFFADQGAFGLGSTVTNQHGFFARSTLTGATNNYGFFSDIGAAAGRWNFYANGSAPNYFAGDVRTNTVVTQATSPTNSNTTATATAASLLSGIRTGTPTANINMTLPTGTNMDAALTSLETNQAFEWSYINLAAATHVVTILGNTDHTLVGTMTVQPATSARFATRKTGANTFVTYRIA